jgi:hypothetical protein
VDFLKASMGFSHQARCWLAASFVLGLCLLGWCSSVDFPPSWWPRWLHNTGYEQNILAAFTSFLIGVPVALILLERVKSNYAQNVQIDAVNRISRAAWSDFSNAVIELCSDERQNALHMTEDNTSATDQVRIEHDVIIDRMILSRDRIKANRNLVSTEVRELQEFLREHRPILSEKLEVAKQQVGTRSTLERPWAMILALWEVLDAHVRLRRLEYRLEPIDETYYIRIRNSMTRPDNPIFEFTRVNEQIGTRMIAESISDVLIMLKELENYPEDKFAVALDKFDEFFGRNGISDYLSRSFSAFSFVQHLRLSVEFVTLSGWPENAKKPTREDG